MRILILGAGGTGGYFGGRLAEADADVSFLVRPQRQANLQQNGLIIRSSKGNARLGIQTLLAEEVSTPYDVVILSCKAYDLDSSIAAIKPAVNQNTLILPILNGMGHLEKLEKAFSPEQILGGVVYIAATLGPEGEVLHLNDFDHFLFGARYPSQVERCQKLNEIFDRANFDNKLLENIMQDMWEKFAFLSTLAGITCLMRGNLGQINNTRYGRELVQQMLSECEAISAAAGYPVRPAATERAQKILTLDPTLTSSMHRDLMNGSKVEADAIVGDLYACSVVLGKPSVLLKAAYTNLQVYQSQSTRK